jgi:RES domain-containing protein
VRLYRFGSDSLRPPTDEFNGQGGVLADGRWHLKGKPAVYASTSEPLALLEKLVHRTRLSTVVVYPLYVAEIPDNLVEELSASDLPPDWRSIYPPVSTKRLGSKWLASQSAVGLLVPSILISDSAREIKNCLINPAHAEFTQVAIEGPIMLPLDPRFGSPV